MELAVPRPFYGTWKRYWRRKRYQRLDGTSGRKKLLVTRFGGSPQRGTRFWKIRRVPKLRTLRYVVYSPLRLLRKMKNSYLDLMINLVGNKGSLNTNGAFGNKRIPKDRQPGGGGGAVVYSSEEVEIRLVQEIYKALVIMEQKNKV